MIKFILHPLEKAAVFQVTDMDEAQRRLHGAALSFTSSCGHRVISDCWPDAFRTPGGRISINIRGATPDRDNEVVVIRFTSNIDRDSFIFETKQALREWVSNGGFADVRHTEILTTAPGVYEIVGAKK